MSTRSRKLVKLARDSSRTASDSAWVLPVNVMETYEFTEAEETIHDSFLLYKESTKNQKLDKKCKYNDTDDVIEHNNLYEVDSGADVASNNNMMSDKFCEKETVKLNFHCMKAAEEKVDARESTTGENVVRGENGTKQKCIESFDIAEAEVADNNDLLSDKFFEKENVQLHFQSMKTAEEKVDARESTTGENVVRGENGTKQKIIESFDIAEAEVADNNDLLSDKFFEKENVQLHFQSMKTAEEKVDARESTTGENVVRGENGTKQKIIESFDIAEAEVADNNDLLSDKFFSMKTAEEKDDASESITGENANRIEQRSIESFDHTSVSDLQRKDVYSSPHLTINKYKRTVCKFCDSDIISKHFARHLERNHGDEWEVKEILRTKKGSVEKKNLLELIRNSGNLEPALRGNINPKKRAIGREPFKDDYSICIYCQGYFKRLCLSRHIKKCFAKCENSASSKKVRPLTESVIYTASKRKYGKILDKLSVKTEIFNKMQADKITEVAINDILIVYFGDDLLKKHKTKRNLYHISNKLRECARFLLEIKKHGEYSDMLSTLRPDSFDDAIEATKSISKYNTDTRSFGAASLALHFGTTLKKLADLATKLLLRKKITYFNKDYEQTLVELKRFKKLIESQWTTEIGSLALKNLNEKASVKPQLLPLTEDIMKLRDLVEKKSMWAYEQLRTTKTEEAYKILAETTLVGAIIHNRKRVGDIQYLDLQSYKEQVTDGSDEQGETEFAACLTENEKILTKNYKRIVSIGKGSRPVTILIPKNSQKYFSMLLKIRMNEVGWFPSENTYFFTFPHTNRWIDGCSVMRKYAKMCGAKNPQLLTSCRLRKHIATVTQLLNLKGNEIDQLARFMGHTSRTHEEFYKLPQSVYQVAKVSKILQMMEKGNAAQFQNRNLEEIDINMDDLVYDEYKPENHKISAADTTIKYSLRETGCENLEKQTANIESGLYQDNDASAESDSTFKVSDTESSSDSEKGNDDWLHKIVNPNRKVPNQPSVKQPGEQIRSRGKWTNKQKKLMERHFSEKILKHKVPNKKECEEFMKAHKEFENVTWVRVKTYIYNVYRVM